MDSNQREIPSLRGKHHNPKELTVMVIRSVGKIRSFTISRRAIVWTSVFLLAYILVSIFIFNNYFDLRYRYKIQSEKLKDTEENLNENNNKLILSEQYVAGLEEYIRDTEEKAEQIDISSSMDRKKDDVINKIVKDVNKKNPMGNRPSRDVDITDITIRRMDSVLNLDFKLVINKSDENPIEGYIHIIAADKNNRYPSVWNNRRDELKNGMPVYFRRGKLFIIQRFRLYHYEFDMNTESEFPSLIKMLIYDKSGKLILEKELKVSDVSLINTASPSQ
jgi:hypothetical protein